MKTQIVHQIKKEIVLKRVPVLQKKETQKERDEKIQDRLKKAGIL